MVIPFSLEPRIHSTCIRTGWMPSNRHIPGNTSYLSGEFLLVEVPKIKHDSGLLFVRRRAEAAWGGFGLGRAVCSGGAIGVPSLALVLAQVLGGGSGGNSGGSDSPGKPNSAAPGRARKALGVNHVRHDTSAAAAVLAAHRAVCRPSDRGGVRSSGRRRRFRAKFFACLLCGIRAAPTACARDGGLQWPYQPSVLCAKLRCGSGPVQPLSPRVRVASVRVTSQSPDTLERRDSALSCRTQIIRPANATMPALHLSMSCARSDASLAYASHASFLGMSQWPRTNCIRVCATQCCWREKRVRPQCESPGDPEPSTCARVLPRFNEKQQTRTLPWKKSR
ncbi:hypothetical protein TcCL_ESM10933 [Trypanosoma cruzi]|nr:hypothetical protein TcCL_ESM10933 [Trypanosoma cruzi]